MESRFQLAATLVAPSYHVLAGAMREAALRADLLEVRLDALGVREGRPDLGRILRSATKPVIFACRRREDGGAFLGTEAERIALLRDALRSGAAFVDLEWETEAQALLLEPRAEATEVVLSHHDLGGIPGDLHALAGRMAAAVASRPEAVVKIAARIGNLAENRSLLDAASRTAEKGTRVAVAGIGPKGTLTRVLAPAVGASLGYFSLERDPEHPLGQISLEDAATVYALGRLGRRTTAAGVLGSPVSRSLSPAMMNEAYRIRALDWVYVPLEGSAGELRDLLRNPGAPGLRFGGFSVTSPEKENALRIADRVDPDASEIGAANTLLLTEGGVLTAMNTDAPGLLDALREPAAAGGAEFDPSGKRCAVIGGGGAARAAVWALRKSGAEVALYARTPTRVESFARRQGAILRPLDRFDAHGFDLVVQATPVGAAPGPDVSPVPYSLLRGVRVACDLVTVPGRTRFLRDAEAHGARTVEGAEVLVRQGARQFAAMTRMEAPVRSMRQAARAMRARFEAGGEPAAAILE